MFNKINHRPLLLLLLLFTLTYCDRRQIECPEPSSGGTLIPLKVRWDKAKISNPAEGITVLLYNQDGSLYRHYDASSTPGTYMLKNIRVNDVDSSFICDIRVDVGSYRVVVFNEAIRPSDVAGVWNSGIANENSEGLRFRGLDRIDTFEAFASEYTNTRTGSVLKAASGQSIVNNPGILASWLSPSLFVVTKEMIDASPISGERSEELNRQFEQLMDIHPERKVASVSTEFYVMHLDHVHPSSFSHTQLQGASGGYYLGLGRYSATPVTHQFSLRNARYSRQDNVPDTLSANFTTFGRIGDVPTAPTDHKYYFDTNILLYDTEQGSPWSYVPQQGDDESVIKVLPTDITRMLEEQFIEWDEQQGTLIGFVLALNLRIYVRNDFSPWGKTESGFGGQVNDWIDEDVTIEL